MIVRWGLHELPAVLDELGVAHPYLITTHRWLDLALPLEPIDTWASSPTHEIERVAEVARGAGVLLALGGGSAIDLAKAVSAETGLPLVSIPTTYSGAEWTTFYGVRDLDRRMRGGGAGAHPAGIVYEPELTAELPPQETCGTALNALAHCAEALYVEGRNDDADLHALTGARLIALWLPVVLDDGHDLAARTALLEGACEAGAALGGSFLALGHAMAQALGGRYGLPHGTLNAICLPAALRFNAEAVPEAIAALGEAMGVDDPAAWIEEQARRVGFTGLGALGVPEDELGEVAEATAARAGAKANPRPATAAQIAELLRTVW
jgi:maleylacetate reductase